MQNHRRKQRVDDQDRQTRPPHPRQHRDIRTANSSPPRRARKASGPRQSRNRSATTLQIGVAGRVAHRVVDGLEIVEVDAEQREGLDCAAAQSVCGKLQCLHQHRAVGQVCQPVELGEVGDARFGVARARDVGTDAAIAAVRRRLPRRTTTSRSGRQSRLRRTWSRKPRRSRIIDARRSAESRWNSARKFAPSINSGGSPAASAKRRETWPSRVLTSVRHSQSDEWSSKSCSRTLMVSLDSSSATEARRRRTKLPALTAANR